MISINLFVAFVAGLASFLAPCVIPLVPAYISFISGISFSDLKNTENASKYRSKVLGNSLLYILGFSLIFILLGLGATAVSRSLSLNRVVLLRAGGVLVTFFGLYTLGVFNRFTFTQKQFQLQLSPKIRNLKYFGPFLMGTTFALAWTPCIGAILGAILTLAATSNNIFAAVPLLASYSLGISLPFLIIALTISSSYKIISRLGSKSEYISRFAGVLLLTIGLLMITQKYDLVTGFLLGQLYKLEFFRNLQSAF